MTSNEFSYTTLFGINSIRPHLEKISKLFSNHYGIYGEGSKKVGERIKMNPNFIEKNYLIPGTGIVMAYLKEILVGYSIFSTFEVYLPNIEDKTVKWILQLVVHSDYRHKKIGKTLVLNSIGSDWDSCGLVSSHPYAVKSLEMSSGYQCKPETIEKYAQILVDNCGIPYMKSCVLHCNSTTSIVDTKFYADHTEVLVALKDMVNNKSWSLGNELKIGQEFFAFVFRERKPTVTGYAELLEHSNTLSSNLGNLKRNDKGGLLKESKQKIVNNVKQFYQSIPCEMVDNFIHQKVKIINENTILMLKPSEGNYSIIEDAFRKIVEALGFINGYCFIKSQLSYQPNLKEKEDGKIIDSLEKELKNLDIQ